MQCESWRCGQPKKQDWIWQHPWHLCQEHRYNMILRRLMGRDDILNVAQSQLCSWTALLRASLYTGICVLQWDAILLCGSDAREVCLLSWIWFRLINTSAPNHCRLLQHTQTRGYIYTQTQERALTHWQILTQTHSITMACMHTCILKHVTQHKNTQIAVGVFAASLLSKLSQHKQQKRETTHPTHTHISGVLSVLSSEVCKQCYTKETKLVIIKGEREAGRRSWRKEKKRKGKGCVFVHGSEFGQTKLGNVFIHIFQLVENQRGTQWEVATKTRKKEE